MEITKIKSIIFLFFIIHFCFNFTSFAQLDSSTSIYQFVKNSEIRKFELEKGRSFHKFTLTDNKRWAMNLSVPDIHEDEKVPLVIALHWSGDEYAFNDYSKCLAFPALEFLNAIIIAPSSNRMRWIDPRNEKRVIKLIKQVIKYWPVDQDKIIITGYSNGGIGSWHYSAKYSELFAAAIPVSGYYFPNKMEVPLYLIHGEKDNLFNVQEMIETIDSSIAMGSQINYQIIPDFNHSNACNYLDALKKMAELVQHEILE